MAHEQADTLLKARENFVRKRRAMAEQMMPAGAASSHFAPSFTEIQLAIEAIDRAIADEEALPPGYGAGPPAIELATLDGASVDRDFDLA